MYGMTEKDWLDCTTPGDLLAWLHGRVSDRKLRLFSCACCRLVWDQLEEKSKKAVLVAEKYVDRQATLPELQTARAEAQSIFDEEPTAPSLAAATVAGPLDPEKLILIASCTAIIDNKSPAKVAQVWLERRKLQCDFIREVIGNPFNQQEPGEEILTWADGFVVRVANTIYWENRFDEMEMLAEALAQAGCQNETLMEHAKAKGSHIRGCWLLDMLLKKR